MPSRIMVADPRIHRPSHALAAAAVRFGTPVYVTDAASVGFAASQLEATFGPPWLRLYSLKANDLPALVSVLHGHGWAASVVSAGEWQNARAGGVANDSVAFEGIGKTDAQLGYAVAEAAAGRPLRWLAIESAQEAVVLGELANDAGLGTDGRPPLDILLRLNPEVSPETRPEFAVGAQASKFGMGSAEILTLAGAGVLTSPGLRLRGVHVHVGSDLNDVAAFATAGVRGVRLLADLRAAVDEDRAGWLDTVDFGGGFPLPADGAPTPAQFRAALGAALGEAGLDLPPRPAIEPGRYLVGEAGWLVASVLHVRAGAGRSQQVVLDAGMTEFIRPALYGSRHPVHVLRTGGGNGAGQLHTALEGPVCESTDSFGSYLLPPLRRGDLVAIGRAGAYGASFTSRYNGRPSPTEALLRPDGSLECCGRPPIAGMCSLPPVRLRHEGDPA
jgi:diaminopimelate decarboxylase